MGLKEWLITEVKWVERWQILLVGAKCGKVQGIMRCIA